ncbi:L-threonylcarbamoyladenylate synthase [Fulvivirgaceae bacterium BMA10]|uniref:L-threonylcarbamoyladenylate synthase n=1 Tax=Splendidivirga corallicola TaxID=3051826 RepID=A0ABT8KKC5_9BACT|nr:L-threonylcarbamoyladenylate synthase [Fulvivirgaceae bacterium BMA10]
MAYLLKLYPENPELRKIEQVVKILKDGGVIIYPTDTIYAIGCDIFNSKAIEKICHLKGIKPGKFELSFICHNISEASNYVRNLSTPVFKVMKKALPGPFTFILNANSKVPKILKVKKSTIGIRVPDNNIPRMIVERLGNPIVTTSIRDEDEIIEYTTDPELIYEKFRQHIDVVIDGGYGKNVPSTVVDCTTENFEVIREGLGDISTYL